MKRLIHLGGAAGRDAPQMVAILAAALGAFAKIQRDRRGGAPDLPREIAVVLFDVLERFAQCDEKRSSRATLSAMSCAMCPPFAPRTPAHCTAASLIIGVVVVVVVVVVVMVVVIVVPLLLWSLDEAGYR